ncbi:MAG: hypothetical protein WC488_01655, partial [Candidatus Micrarchaeia archaeon]
MTMKKEIAITALLLVVAAALVLGINMAGGNYEERDAKKVVLEDLQERFPYADKIEIIAFEPRTNGDQRYFAIKASVSDDLDMPCPKRTHYYYNYPEQNFVPAPPEYIVKTCRVCENKPCIIAFPEEAIIASHTLAGTGEVSNYIVNAGDVKPYVSKIAQGW